MMTEKLTSAQVSFEGKSKKSLPEGATVKNKSVRITVKEIENGFILSKSYDISYTKEDGQEDYLYYISDTYSKTNPIKKDQNKALADFFD